MKAAILLSGGMDSISVAWWKRPELAITIDYGQCAAEAEIGASKQVCRDLDIRHETLRVDCRAFGSGDLINEEADAKAPASDWWPYRNQLLVTLACMKGIALGIDALYLGAVKSDGEYHSDGKREFVALIDELVSFQEGGIRILAPAIEFSTADLVEKANVPPELLAWAHSCHKGVLPCGACRGCYKYFDTLRELGGQYSV